MKRIYKLSIAFFFVFACLIMADTSSRVSSLNGIKVNVLKDNFLDNVADRIFKYTIEKAVVENENNSKHIASINKQLNSKVKKFENDVKKQLRAFRKNPITNYEYLYNIDLKYKDNNVVVFLEDKYIYTGGANGMRYIVPIMYSFTNAKEISTKTSSIIIDKSAKPLVTLVQKKLLKKFDKDFYFDFSSITLPDTFYMSSEGLTFIYGLYEIAPRTAGIVELSFSFEEIKPFIDMKKLKELKYYF